MKLYMHPVALLFSQFSDDVNPTLADHQPTVGCRPAAMTVGLRLDFSVPGQPARREFRLIAVIEKAAEAF